MMYDLSKCLWVSENQKWAIKDIKKEDGLTVAWVLDFVKGKGFEVTVEHIVKGKTMLIWGELAKETYDNIVSDKPIPKYLQDKILEFSKVSRVTL